MCEYSSFGLIGDGIFEHGGEKIMSMDAEDSIPLHQTDTLGVWLRYICDVKGSKGSRFTDRDDA